MRLIDADELIESMGVSDAVKWGNKDGYQQDRSYSTLMCYEIKDYIDSQPTIGAVPLDKLCEWLSENSINIPCEACPNFSNEYCTAIGDASKPCPNTANDWRRAITEWMEGPQCTSTDMEH